jgi:hypothetical protein
MTKSEKIRQIRLAEIESEFLPLLISCLRKCAQGRWGLFGQNDVLGPEGRYWGGPETKRLKDLAQEIRSLHLEFGTTNEISERFLRLCSLRGQNIPGEPRLAAELLAAIDNEAIEKGLEASRSDQTISHAAVGRMIDEWTRKAL